MRLNIAHAPKEFSLETSLHRALQNAETHIEEVFDDYSTTRVPALPQASDPTVQITSTITTYAEVRSPFPSESLVGKGRNWKKNQLKRSKRRNARSILNDGHGSKFKESALKHVAPAIDRTLDAGIEFEDTFLQIANKPAWTAREHTLSGQTTYNLDDLINRWNMEMVEWDGKETTLIVDSFGRIITILAGQPRDSNWHGLQANAAAKLEDIRQSGVLKKLPKKYVADHRRGDFPSVGYGISHGGGQPFPRRLVWDKDIIEALNSLVHSEAFQRFSGFSNQIFSTYSPRLHKYYNETLDEIITHSENGTLVKNFEKSAFACASFNFGPQTVSIPHTDYGNLAWGMCGLTAMGDFNPDEGGMVVLWDINRVVRVPPGSTMHVPSAVLCHSNASIGKDETRYSFTQYSAGGIFRWKENGFQTQDSRLLEIGEDNALLKAREEAQKYRWAKGVSMFSTVAELRELYSKY